MESNQTALQVQPNSQKKRLIISAAIVLLLVLVFGAGFSFGSHRLKIDSQLKITKGNTPAANADYSLLWDALDALNSKFIDRPLDQQKLMYGAIAGLVSATGDPYTSYFDPEQARDFSDQLKGTFDGIGAEVGIKDDQIVIIAPLDDTPAQKAGLQAGDAILAINGESTAMMSVEMAVSKIRGRAGSDVTLTILRAGKRSAQDVKITRSRISVKSVKFEEKEVSGKKVGVIKISQFGEDTKGLFDQAVDQILSGNDQAVILDLRNDPGGYLDSAVTLASSWVQPDSVVVKEINYKGEIKEYKPNALNRLSGIKTIILVNGGSASASEILAGCLQDYGLATLVGTKTFGKGSVQELTMLKDNSEMKITIAKWLTPKGRTIDKVGLEPDIKVDEAGMNLTEGIDPQMDKALELAVK